MAASFSKRIHESYSVQGGDLIPAGRSFGFDMESVSGEGKAPAPYRNIISNPPYLMEPKFFMKSAALEVKRCRRNTVLCGEPEPRADASKQKRDTGPDKPLRDRTL